jgi:mono/diheme cytochrome c family protein
MIPGPMSRTVKRVLVAAASAALALGAAACGEETISVPKSQGALHEGAVLFNQRCAGCHTLSYAATHGSAANVRTAEYNNGPNFDIRCERPITRVLYAIENGGFSGAVMPQNVVVGQQAIDVAKFVATYAGRQAPKVPGVTPCEKLSIGTLPSPTSSGPSTATAQVQKAAQSQSMAAPTTASSKRTRHSKPSRSGTKARQGTGSG